MTDISEDTFLAVVLPPPDAELYPYLFRASRVIHAAAQTNLHLMAHLIQK